MCVLFQLPNSLLENRSRTKVFTNKKFFFVYNLKLLHNTLKVYKDYTTYAIIVTCKNKQEIKVYVYYHFKCISEAKNLCELCKLNCRKHR